ncbi:MAG: hypothetical protein Q8L36_00050 [bacterium]|nr:hypothetical protein [bacterium]
MIWQDFVFTIGSWIFIIALLPAIFGKNKPPISTSFTTGFVMIFFAIAYFTLELWLSTISAAILALAWLLLGWQKYLKRFDEKI